jgi:guanylate kinase
MGKIFCLMGKSSSGKDTIYKMLLEQKEIMLKTIIPYTTRPIRSGEQEGVEYHFSTEEQLQKLLEDNRVIELRQYNTIHGIWKYFTVNDGQIDFQSGNYLIIGTLESYQKIRKYYGEELVLPIYIEVDDGLRLQRALDRERLQDAPKYSEMCRRFLADAEDFSDEKLKEAGITKHFLNEELERTVSDIACYIKEKSQ